MAQTFNQSVSTDLGLLGTMSQSELTTSESVAEGYVSLFSSMTNTLRKFFTDVLEQASEAWGIFNEARTFFYFSVTSALISTISSVLTLYSNKGTFLTKTLLVSTMVMNLITIIQACSIVSKCGVNAIPFDSDRATSALTSLVTEHLQALPDDDPPTIANAPISGIIDWVKIGVSFLVVSVLMGLGVSGTLSFADIRTGTGVVDGLKKTWSTVGDITSFILTEVLSLSEEKDLTLIEDMERLATRLSELALMVPAEFVMNDDLYYELSTVEKRARELTSKKMSADSSKRLQVVRQLIMHHLSKIFDKMQQVNDIRNQTKRPATIAVVLSGSAGVGKSSWAEHIMAKVASKLDFNKRIYNLNHPKDGFWIPYGGESCGIYNEFMAYREDDPLLPDLNLICSEDPWNFESAHLEGKVQPSRLRLVFITTNDPNPPFHRTMNDGAARAVWDRLIHIHVEDPLFKGRQYDHTHRKADYTHLKLTRVFHSPDVKYGDGVKTVPITHDQLYSTLVGRSAASERRYLEFALENAKDQEDRDKITTRIAHMADLISLHNPFGNPAPPVWEEVADFDPFCGGEVPLTTAKKSKRLPPKAPVIANAGADCDFGRDFFVLRFQGPVGSGKTTQMRRLAEFAHEIFGLQIQYCTHPSDFKPDPSVPMIYLLDDVIFPDTYQDFVYGMNSTHPLSVFMISTNDVFYKCEPSYLTRLGRFISRFNTADPWDGTNFVGPEALLRRLGLEGYVRLPKGEVQTGNFYTKTYTFDSNFVVRKTYMDQITIYEDIETDFYAGYVKFLTVGGGVPLVNRAGPAIADPDIEVHATSERHLLETLKSATMLPITFAGLNKHVKIIVKPSVAERDSGQTTFKTWMIPETSIERPAERRALMTRLFGSLNRLIPGCRMVVLIDGGKQRYVLHDGVGYYCEPTESTGLVTIRYTPEHEAVVTYLGNDYAFTAKQFVAAAIYNQFDATTSRFPKDLYVDLRYKLAGLDPSHTPDPVFLTIYKIEEGRQRTKMNVTSSLLYTMLLKHPIVVTLATILFSFTSCYLLLKLVRFIFKFFQSSSNPDSLVCDCWVDWDWSTSYPPTRIDPECRKCNPNSHFYDQSKPPPNLIRRSYQNTSDMEDPAHIVPKRALKHMTGARTRWSRPNTSDLEDPSHPVGRKITRSLRGTTSAKWRSVPNAATPTQVARLLLDRVEEGTFPEERFIQAVEEDDEFAEAYENMLHVEAEIRQPPTELQRFSKQLNKYYYQISSPGGANYAIAIGGRLLVTTAHSIHDESLVYKIYDGRKYYDSKCVYICRPRELAVVRILDKSFNNQPRIANLFIDDDDIADVLYAFYVRPLENNYAFMGSYVSFHPHLDIPVEARNNPQFRLSDMVVAFTLFSSRDLMQVIKLGDCGFPLVANTNSGYRIMGIHNAYNEVERRAWFTGLTRQDIEHIYTECLDSAVQANNVDLDNTAYTYFNHALLPKPFIIHKAYADGLADLLPSRFSHHEGLEILGYSKRLHFVSKPKFTKTCVRPTDAEMPLLSVPSALDLSDVTDFSKLCADSMGRYDTLFTQLYKYKLGPKLEYDHALFEHVISLKESEYKGYYGVSSQLRFHEVVNGIPGEPQKPLDMKTAAGPYMKLVHRIQTKAPLFDILEKEDASYRRLRIRDTKAGQDLRAQYDDILSFWRAGQPYLFLSKDCAKVELLPTEKVAQGKVRLFNELDLAVNMALKKVFGGLLNSVMRNHEDSPIKIGQNPYTHSTRLWQQFAEIPGKIISTDYSAFDKSIPSDLIMAFTRIASRLIKPSSGMSPEQHSAMFDAIGASLCYVLHSCNGTIALVNRGNESGTFVTTLLNSVVVDFVDTYAVCAAFRDRWGFLPSVQEFCHLTRRATFGDDMVRKVSDVLPCDTSTFEKAAASFGLSMTAAKGTGAADVFDFCSRTFSFDEVRNVVFPQLKKSSISGCLFWVTTTDRQDILDNMSMALFEAAFHDEDFYNMIERDAFKILKSLKINPTLVHLQGYKLIRDRFRDYVICGGDIPAISLAYGRVGQSDSRCTPENFSAILEQLKRQRTIKTLPQLITELEEIAIGEATPQKIMSAKGRVFETLAKAKISDLPVESFVKTGSDHAPSFEVTVEWRGFKSSATRSLKKAAASAAYFGILPHILSTLKNEAQANGQVFSNNCREPTCHMLNMFMDKSITHHLAIAKAVVDKTTSRVVVVAEKYPSDLVVVDDEDYLYHYSPGLDEFFVRHPIIDRLSYDEVAEVYLRYPHTRLTGNMITFDFRAQANMDTKDTSIETSPVSGVNANPGMTTIPNLPNPIPTKIQPSMAENTPAVMAAQDIAPVQDLVPIGPPNLLTFGAIGFDLKDLCYSQFLDSNIQYTYTDDSQEGTILFQIPYDPLSEFCNPYIRRYVGMHGRYAGSLQYRVTIIGNSTYSGLIGVSWVPSRIRGTRVNISDVQKYSYYAESITLPSNRILTLHDARQTQFYRTTEPQDTSDRPHLVVYVMVSAVSPLRTGITIRIRVASKLCANEPGCQPFQVSEPLLDPRPINPGPGPSSPFIGMNFARFFPFTVISSLPQITWRIGCDGNRAYKRSYQPLNAKIWANQYLPFGGSLGNIAKWAPQNNFPRQAFWLPGGTPGDANCLVNKERKLVGSFAAATYPVGFVSVDISRVSDPRLVGDFLAKMPSIGTDIEFCWVIDDVFTGLTNFVSSPDIAKKYGVISAMVTTSDNKQYVFAVNKNDIYVKNLTFNNNVQIVIYTVAGPLLAWVSRGNMALKITGTSKEVMPGIYMYPPPEYMKPPPTIGQVILGNKTIDYLPVGWRNLVFTRDTMPFTPSNYRGPTVYDEYLPRMAITSQFDTVSTTQCIQIRLNDVDSNRVAMTLRVFPDTMACVINTLPEEDGVSYYTTYNRPLSSLYISEFSVVERSTEFYVTPMVGFSSRQIGEPKLAMANAGALLGGALSGLGSGLGAWQQHLWQRELWGDMFKNQKDLQRFWAQHQKDLFRLQSESQALFQDRQHTLAGYRTPAASYGVTGDIAGASPGTETPEPSTRRGSFSSYAETEPESLPSYKPSPFPRSPAQNNLVEYGKPEPAARTKFGPPVPEPRYDHDLNEAINGALAGFGDPYSSVKGDPHNFKFHQPGDGFGGVNRTAPAPTRPPRGILYKHRNAGGPDLSKFQDTSRSDPERPRALGKPGSQQPVVPGAFAKSFELYGRPGPSRDYISSSRKQIQTPVNRLF